MSRRTPDRGDVARRRYVFATNLGNTPGVPWIPGGKVIIVDVIE